MNLTRRDSFQRIVYLLRQRILVKLETKEISVSSKQYNYYLSHRVDF